MESDGFCQSNAWALHLLARKLGSQKSFGCSWVARLESETGEHGGFTRQLILLPEPLYCMQELVASGLE